MWGGFYKWRFGFRWEFICVVGRKVVGGSKVGVGRGEKVMFIVVFILRVTGKLVEIY